MSFETLILAAVDPGDIVKIVAGGIVFVLWLVGQIVSEKQKATKIAKQKPRPAQPRQAANPPRQKPQRGNQQGAGQGFDPLTTEIDNFLEKARQKQPAKPTQPATRQAPKTPQRQPEKPVRTLVQRQTEEAPILLAVEEPKTFPGSVSQHVQQHMDVSSFGERTSELGREVGEADDKMVAHIHSAFDHSLGSLSHENVSPEAENYEEASRMASSIAKIFANPETVSQAILVNEILTRPTERW